LISKHIVIASLIAVVGITSPLCVTYFVTPSLIDWYEDGYTIGATLDLTYVKPLNTIYDLSDGWTVVEQENKKWLEKTVSYEHGQWPDDVELNLATTEKHESGVEFRTFIHSNFSWIGPFPESFVFLDYTVVIIGGVISGIQSIMLVIKKSKPDIKNVYFYQIHHLVINYSKNVIVFHK